jgi:hypothetical protein
MFVQILFIALNYNNSYCTNMVDIQLFNIMVRFKLYICQIYYTTKNSYISNIINHI